MTEFCSECGRNEATVHINCAPGESLHLCWDCHNARLAEEIGICLIPFRIGIYKYTGIGNKKHRFNIHRMLLPTGINFEAHEKTKNRKPGYRVVVSDSPDCDQETLFARLDAKIRTIVLNPCLEKDTDPAGRERINLKNDQVEGYFLYNDKDDGTYDVVIDGQVFTWEEFGQMMEPYEGFQFQLKIIDPSDDLK